MSTTATMTPSVIRLSNLSVEFPGVKALDSVNLDIAPGEIRALMGRNGAGKSTLVRVLSGVQTDYSGTIEVRGETAEFRTPNDAMASGIATVHQELTIIPGLTIAENVLLGQWRSRFAGQMDYAELKARAREALDQLGEELDIDAPAGSLSIARQQLVEIARALTHKPQLLILDEPTSSLPAHEVDRLLALVRRLAATGVAVVFVSHRMDEISRVADSVTVVRDGRVIDTLPIDQAPVQKVASLMVGSGFEEQVRDTVQPPAADAPVALRVQNLSDETLLDDVSLDVRAGEILGIAGLLGAGRTELLKAIAGMGRVTGGSIEVFGTKVTKLTPGVMIDRGVTLVPEDRKAEGLVLGLPVRENLWMSSKRLVSRLGILNTESIKRVAERSRADLDIKVHDTVVAASTLSGGNQQKVVLGRCLNAGSRILLLDEPTRGVDVHAKAQIYDLVRRFAQQGYAVVMVSSEYEELLLLCHSIAAMSHGRITDRFEADGMTLTDLFTRVLRTETDD